MNYQDLQNLLDYASRNNLNDRPFQEVYNSWKQDMEDAYKSWAADQYLASQEFYERNYDIAV